MVKNCKICGKEFKTIKMGNSRIYCFECSPSYQKDNNIERGSAITAIRIALKKRLVEIKGGSCEICGYNKSIKALQFHHTNPEKKDFNIGDYTGSKNVNVAKAFEEVQKCQLLCANCHAEVHDLNGSVAETD